MFRKLFTDHPASVDETYVEHFGIASRFGFTLIGGGLACFVHAFVPAFCTRTGSDTVKRLNDELQARRQGFTHKRPIGDYAIEYHI